MQLAGAPGLAHDVRDSHGRYTAPGSPLGSQLLAILESAGRTIQWLNLRTRGNRHEHMSSRLEQRVASSTDAGARAGRAAANSAGIEVHVSELRQIFDEMDPSPFHDRDLDPKAAEYIVGWARELPIHAPVSLLVHLDRSAGWPDEAAHLGDAIRQFFSGRSAAARQRLKQLFRSGRISLLI